LDANTGQQVWKNAGTTGVNTFTYFGGMQGLSAGNGFLFMPNGNYVTAFRLSAAP
jgi:hypothetical protein